MSVAIFGELAEGHRIVSEPPGIKARQGCTSLHLFPLEASEILSRDG